MKNQYSAKTEGSRANCNEKRWKQLKKLVVEVKKGSNYQNASGRLFIKFRKFVSSHFRPPEGALPAVCNTLAPQARSVGQKDRGQQLGQIEQGLALPKKQSIWKSIHIWLSYEKEKTEEENGQFRSPWFSPKIYVLCSHFAKSWRIFILFFFTRVEIWFPSPWYHLPRPRRGRKSASLNNNRS